MLKEAGHIRSPRIEAAFRAIPRHLFVPDKPLEEVYSSKGGFGLQLSDGRKVGFATSPGYVAEILELLNLGPGGRIMEIGAGSGYTSSLAAHIVGESGQVITIDIEEELVKNVNTAFEAVGLHWAKAICCDGVLGYPEGSPYDLIFMTTGVWDISPAWWEQLKPGGRLFIPLYLRGNCEKIIEFEQSDKCLIGLLRQDTQFSPMRGNLESPGDRFDVGPKAEDYLYVWIDDRSTNGVAKVIFQLLMEPSKDWPLKISVTMKEIRGLMLWLALKEHGYCSIWDSGGLAKTGVMPYIVRYDEFWVGKQTHGLLGDGALSLLMRPSSQPARSGVGIDDLVPFDLHIRSFGQDDGIAQRLADQIIAWDKAGRPSGEGSLRVRAYPKDNDYLPAEDDLVIDKRWTQLVINWPNL